MSPRVDTDFPGGNLRVTAFDGGTLDAEPDQRDSGEPWFWWCFRVRDPGPGLVVRFARPFCLGPLGPACSLDGGRSWTWLGAAACDGDGFAWRRPDGCDEVRFAMAPPYLAADWRGFAGQRPGIRQHELCTSRRGRRVPYALVGDDGAAQRVLLSARHHACESSASWVIEGFLDAWLARPVPAAQLLVLPLVDLDGVEDGDPGKSRRPHDHNRDYIPDPVHPETAAIQSLVPAWADGRLRLGIDLHAPWIRHCWNEHIYAVGSRDPLVAGRQGRFMDLLQACHAGPLPIGPRRLLPHGTAWNTAASSPTCSAFVKRMGALGLSIEIPYAGVRPDGIADIDDAGAIVPCTPAGLRLLGASLAQAAATWLDMG